MDERLEKELRAVRIELEAVLGMQRLLLATQLLKDGHAKDLREAAKIARDPSKFAALYPVPD